MTGAAGSWTCRMGTRIDRVRMGDSERVNSDELTQHRQVSRDSKELDSKELDSEELDSDELDSDE